MDGSAAADGEDPGRSRNSYDELRGARVGAGAALWPGRGATSPAPRGVPPLASSSMEAAMQLATPQRLPTPRGGPLADSAESAATSTGSPSGVGMPSVGSAGLGGYTPPRTRPLSGRTTPILQRIQTSVSPIAIASARGQQDSIVSLVRREVEHAESRLRAEISRLRETVASSLEKMDRLREAALQRLEQKVVSHETAQCKLERKMSEMSGAIRGLSDETQLQIRRADTSDTRLWEFRHQLEELFQKKVADLEAHHQEFASKHRSLATGSEDAEKRLQQTVKRLEGSLEDRTAQNERQGEALRAIQERVLLLEDLTAQAVQAVEEARVSQLAREAAEAQELSIATREQDLISDTRLWQVEQRLADVSQTVERLSQEAHSDGGWDARLQEHEVRIGGLRSKVDSAEQHYLAFDDRVRGDWDSRFSQLQKSVQDMVTKQFDDTARLEALVTHAEGMDQAIEDIRSEAGYSGYAPYLQVPAVVVSPASEEPYFGLGPPLPNGGSAEANRDELVLLCRDKIDQLKEQANLSLHSMEGGAGMAIGSSAVPREVRPPPLPRPSAGGGGGGGPSWEMPPELEANVRSIVEQLQDVVPKVVEHDKILRSLPRLTSIDGASSPPSAVAAEASAAAAATAAAAAEAAAASAEAAARDAMREADALPRLRVQLLDDCRAELLRQPGALGLGDARQAELDRDTLARLTRRVEEAEARNQRSEVVVQDLRAWAEELRTQLLAGLNERSAEAAADRRWLGDVSARLDGAEAAAQRSDSAVQDLRRELAALQTRALALPSTSGADPEDLVRRFSQKEAEVQMQMLRQAEALQKLQDAVALVAEQLESLRAAPPAFAVEVAVPQPQPQPPRVYSPREAAVLGALPELPSPEPLSAPGSASGLGPPPNGGNPAALDEELSRLFSRVADSELECTRIQQQLQGRISNMDKLLEKVATDVFRPLAADGLPSSAIPVMAALESGGNSLHALPGLSSRAGSSGSRQLPL